jgi:hypothetical protein
MSDEGHLGFGPNFCEEGGMIFVIPGHGTPLLLRPLPGVNSFRFVGECYVHGIMDGEALESTRLRLTG